MEKVDAKEMKSKKKDLKVNKWLRIKKYKITV